MLWADNWSGSILKNSFPHLLSFSRKPKRSFSYLLVQDLDRISSLPLSCQAVEQLSELQELLEARNLDEEATYSWTYTWGSSSFNTRKAYKHILGTLEASPLFPWLWSSGNLGKHKFFFWLLLRDKLNTRNLLRRKDRAIDDYSCVLCNNGVEESAFHLFFECPFSQSCWDSINIHWNTNLQPLDMVIEARTNFGSIIFREIMITAY